jgi:hypothetical protein
MRCCRVSNAVGINPLHRERRHGELSLRRSSFDKCVNAEARYRLTATIEEDNITPASLDMLPPSNLPAITRRPTRPNSMAFGLLAALRFGIGIPRSLVAHEHQYQRALQEECRPRFYLSHEIFWLNWQWRRLAGVQQRAHCIQSCQQC